LAGKRWAGDTVRRITLRMIVVNPLWLSGRRMEKPVRDHSSQLPGVTGGLERKVTLNTDCKNSYLTFFQNGLK
jgi:hypothetical protein